MDFAKLLESYNYQFPEKLIAQKPASPRDSAKLLVYKKSTGEIFFDTFLNLPKYLPQKSILVFNETKVFPARIELTKDTGGKVRALYINKDQEKIKVIADRKINIPSKLFITKNIYFTATHQEENFYYLKPNFEISKLASIFARYGQTPIPPYIKHSPLSEKELRERYQAVFARKDENLGSVAAPTASLHFTKRLIKKIEHIGIKYVFITLDVGMGTFAPLKEENISLNKLHKEKYEISTKTAKFLNKAKQDGYLIIPVGTTALRALESASITNGNLEKLAGETDIFIQEDYNFKFADGMITNFHVPKSSLMMLVSAILKTKNTNGREKILEIYKLAIKNKFRLFSFGDGMLIVE